MHCCSPFLSFIAIVCGHKSLEAGDLENGLDEGCTEGYTYHIPYCSFKQSLRFQNAGALELNSKQNKLAFTWKNAIPKDIPAMIPKLDSIAVVTREKQPCSNNETQLVSVTK